MKEQEPGRSLLDMINRPGGSPQDYADEVYGRVQSTTPLTIWVNQDMQLSGSFLELTTEARGLTVSVELPVTGGGAKDGQKAMGTIEIFPTLQVGDKVRMLRVQKGQRFIVLGRA